jgi:vitamin B12 transporter
VRGPQSTLYGSDALAGIINIITKRGDKNAQYYLNSEGGSNGYYRGSISALGTIGVISYYISGSRSMSDGISASDSKYGNNEKDGYWNNSVSARLGVNLPLNIKLDLIYKFSKSETALDQSEKFGDDPNYTYNIEEHHLKAGVTSSSFGERWKQQFFGSVVRRVSHSADLTDMFRPNTSSDSYNNARRIKFEWQNNFYFFRNNIITFGIETGKETARTSYYSTGDWGPFESVFPEQSISTTGIYLQDQLNILNTFFAAIGIRYDNNEKFGGVTTFRIAPAYFINETGTKLKMSYGSGFKAPSLFYLFDPVFGNPDLKPEKSRGWDFGIEQSLYGGNLIVCGTYFDLKLEDMFGFDSNFRTVNIARASSRGFELTAQLNNIGSFSVRMNYTYNKTRDEYESSPDFGKPLLRRPQDQLSVIAGCNLSEKVIVNMLIKYVGRRDDKDFSSFQSVRVSIPDYTLVNIAASYKILSYLEVTGRIENLFNKKYEEVLYYGTLGRSVYLGMRLGF